MIHLPEAERVVHEYYQAFEKDKNNNMDNLKHKAILAKNQIARMHKANNITEMRLVAYLKDIEAYLGEGNQPSVYDILNSEQNI